MKKSLIRFILTAAVSAVVFCGGALCVSAAPAKYVVEKGDNLINISKLLYGNPLDYKRIYEANSDIIKNPDLIFIGQEFFIPQSAYKTTPSSAKSETAADSKTTESGSKAYDCDSPAANKDTFPDGDLNRVTKKGISVISLKVKNETGYDLTQLLIGPGSGTTDGDSNVLKEELKAGESIEVEYKVPAEYAEEDRWTVFVFDSEGYNSGIYSFFYPDKTSSVTIRWDEKTRLYTADYK